MFNSNQFLFLASGVKNDEEFWFVGVKNSDENILDDTNLLDCHRKELIGTESANDILFAIHLNFNNLFDGLEKNKFLINQPLLGISHNIPLDYIENIFDFWLDTYKEEESWETCLGLLKIRKRISLSNLIMSGSLKGNSKRWAMKVESLHSYKISSLKNSHSNKPMWT